MKEKVNLLLKEKGYKITKQRELVLEVFVSNPNKHMTSEEIYNCIKLSNPDVGLATVYRTIQLFLDLKLIDSLTLNDGIVRYELSNEEEQHHHHHLICEKCNKVIEMKEDLLEDVEEKCCQLYHFKITNHFVKFYGICEECMKKLD
jgi:Fur family ferric uptake transcriptional regulator